MKEDSLETFLPAYDTIASPRRRSNHEGYVSLLALAVLNLRQEPLTHAARRVWHFFTEEVAFVEIGVDAGTRWKCSKRLVVLNTAAILFDASVSRREDTLLSGSEGGVSALVSRSQCHVCLNELLGIARLRHIHQTRAAQSA